MELKLVSVKWVDITHDSNDLNRKQVEQLVPTLMQTLGFLHLDSEDKLVISGTVVHDTEFLFRDSVCIPKSNVLTIDYLMKQKKEPEIMP